MKTRKRRKINQAVIDRRRAAVASMLARKMTERQIQDALAKEPNFWNPTTEKPWSLGTIHHDCRAVIEAWRESAQEEIGTRIARELAELDEVKRQGWKEKDLNAILRAIGMEMDLLGTKKPMLLAPTDPTGTKPYDGLSETERNQRIITLLERARARRDGETPPGDESSGDDSD